MNYEKMTEEEWFDKCIETSIKLGRKYMTGLNKGDKKPTKEEWMLACMLYIRNHRHD